MLSPASADGRDGAACGGLLTLQELATKTQISAQTAGAARKAVLRTNAIDARSSG
jgi:hypothetical protein